MKQYEKKFSPDQLKEILFCSNSYDEALEKLGYTQNNANRKIIKEISSKYDINIDHFISKQTTNLIGQRFGKLVVKKKVLSNGHGARWLCECDCGNYCEVDANHLKRNEIQSCGCYRKEQISEYNLTTKLIDLTGQRFGKLTVLYRGPNKGEQPTWICKCDCGTITHPIMGGNLRGGMTKSCGCLVSQGELKIREIFQANNIKFKTQVSFLDCFYKDLLRFDFGVYDEEDNLQYLIEYQGVQHYQEMNWTKDTLETRKMRDNIKVEYCKKNNIPLLIIPYTKYSTLSINDLIMKGK